MQKKEKKREIEASSIIFNLILSVLAFSIMISLASESVEALTLPPGFGSRIGWGARIPTSTNVPSGLTQAQISEIAREAGKAGAKEALAEAGKTGAEAGAEEASPSATKGLEKAFTFISHDAILGSFMWAAIIGGLAYGIANMAGLSGDQSKAVGLGTFAGFAAMNKKILDL